MDGRILDEVIAADFTPQIPDQHVCNGLRQWRRPRPSEAENRLSLTFCAASATLGKVEEYTKDEECVHR